MCLMADWTTVWNLRFVVVMACSCLSMVRAGHSRVVADVLSIP